MSEDEKKESEAEAPESKDWAEFIVEHEEPIGRLVDRIAEHFHRELGDGRRHRLSLARAQARMGLFIASAVIGIILIGLILTYVLVRDGLLPGETFVFFSGALLGSLITFLSERVTSLLFIRELEEEGE